MTFGFAPYSSGAGSAMTDAQWGEFAKALLGTGVIKGALIGGSAGNDLAVTAPGSGMTVNLGTGQAMVYGHWCQNDASAAQTITASDPTNPRIDRVVLKHDVTAKTVSIVVKAGAPAPSPTAPLLTQTPSTWEMSLAQIRVNAGVSAINSANVTDERTYATASNALPLTGGTLSGKPTVSLALGGSIQEFVRLTATDGKIYALCLNTDGTFVVRNITDGMNVLVLGATGVATLVGALTAVGATFTGGVSLSNAQAQVTLPSAPSASVAAMNAIVAGDSSTRSGFAIGGTSTAQAGSGYLFVSKGSSGNITRLWTDGTDLKTDANGGATQTVWHSGNDGPSSALDADTVDGFQASAFAQLAALANFTAGLQTGGKGVVFAQAGLTGKFSAQSTAPASPSDGDLWLDTSTVLG